MSEYDSNTALAKLVSDAVKNGGKMPTEQQRIQAEILQKLAELGGQVVKEDALTFEGTKIVLPKSMEGRVDQVEEFLRDWRRNQETTFRISKTYNYRPYDGAAAFERAMKSQFGTAGIGKATFSLFGSNPPEYQTIASGPHGETIQVPWGEVEFSPLEATFDLSYGISRDYGLVFAISVEAPKKNRAAVAGFFTVLEKELENHSLYKGHAITADNMEPGFLDVNVDPSKVIYKKDVLTQLDVNLWAPMRYADAMRSNGVTLKRAVLVEGPNGTGKTLAGALTSKVAVENGWTYILVRSGDDPLDAIKTARAYAPAVVWVEDLDVMADTSQDRKKIAAVLDALDNVQAKGVEVMVGFTSNFADKLDKSVVRPGRLDAVIHVAELDPEGYERLVRSIVSADILSEDVDFGKVVESYVDARGQGFLPAFAKEAAERAVRYNVARNAGVPGKVTTEDLVDAARGMADHLKLMDEAQNAPHERETVDARLSELVGTEVTEQVTALFKRAGIRMRDAE